MIIKTNQTRDYYPVPRFVVILLFLFFSALHLPPNEQSPRRHTIHDNFLGLEGHRARAALIINRRRRQTEGPEEECSSRSLIHSLSLVRSSYSQPVQPSASCRLFSARHRCNQKRPGAPLPYAHSFVTEHVLHTPARRNGADPFLRILKLREDRGSTRLAARRAYKRGDEGDVTRKYRA